VELGAAAGNLAPEKVSGPKLIIVSRGDRSGDGLRLPGIRRSFAAMPEPKRLLVVDGSAHAQALFGSREGGHVMREILRFLSDN
jgi:hypothetical protein